MSEIKFACAYCSQHILCDEIFCGERTKCPGCGKELFVPPRAAFIPTRSGNLSLSLPVASKERPPVSAIGQGPGDEDQGAASALQTSEDKFPVLLPFWIILFLPFVIALVIAKQPGGLRSIVHLFVLCAVVAGFYLAAVQKKGDAATVLRGLLYAIGMFFVFVIVGVGLLFVGCVILLSSH